jgi:hypothetical protein
MLQTAVDAVFRFFLLRRLVLLVVILGILAIVAWNRRRGR